MKAFTFRLETLLHLREMAKDKAIAEYGVAIRQREESEKLLDQGHRALDDLKQEIGVRRTVGFSGSEQEPYNRSINHAKERIIDLNARVQEARKVEDFKRNQFLETDSSYKSLLRLKEKQKEEHLEHESKKEERELGDVIGARFVFNKASSN